MGVEAAVGGALAAGMGYLGYREQRKARKGQERVLNEQRQVIGQERDKFRAEQDRTNKQLEATKKRLALGMARSNRRRQKGGLFGESAEASQPAIRASLGG